MPSKLFSISLVTPIILANFDTLGLLYILLRSSPWAFGFTDYCHQLLEVYPEYEILSIFTDQILSFIALLLSLSFTSFTWVLLANVQLLLQARRTRSKSRHSFFLSLSLL